MPPNPPKKPKYGTTTALAVFLAALLLPPALIFFLLSRLGSSSPAVDRQASFGPELLLVYLVPVLVPLCIVVMIIGLLFALSITKAYRRETMPNNHSAGLVVWGLALAIPSWIVSYMAWSSQNLPYYHPSRLPIILATFSQIALLIALGFIGRTSDVTRRKVWAVILCAAIWAPALLMVKFV